MVQATKIWQQPHKNLLYLIYTSFPHQNNLPAHTIGSVSVESNTRAVWIKLGDIYIYIYKEEILYHGLKIIRVQIDISWPTWRLFFNEFLKFIVFLNYPICLLKKQTLPCNEPILGDRGKIKYKKIISENESSKNSPFLPQLPRSHNESHPVVFPTGKFPQNQCII